MLNIYKYRIPDWGGKIMLPLGARILDVQLQNDIPTLWAAVDPALAPEEYWVDIIGTGSFVPENLIQYYVKTVQQDQLVWHIFVTKEENK